MDIKIETSSMGAVKTDRRARKTTLGEGFTTAYSIVRLSVTGADAWDFSKASSIGSRLERTKGHDYLPDEMKKWLGLGSDAVITAGWFTTGMQGAFVIDFGFKLTKRGRGHANFGKQFTVLLSQLDQEGTLQEIAKRIVEDELTRVERAASDEAKRRRLESVAAFIVSSVKEQAEILLDYRIKLDALRQERLNKMDQLCTDDLLDQLATEHSLSLEALKDEVAQRLVHRPLAFSLGD